MSLSSKINEEIAVLRGNKIMKDQILYRVRKFLNRKGHHSTAFVFAELSKHVSKGRTDKKTGKKKKDHIWYDAELKISDCDRMINLSIDSYNKRSADNTIYKLDIMIKVLKEFRDIFSKELNSHFKSKTK